MQSPLSSNPPPNAADHTPTPPAAPQAQREELSEQTSVKVLCTKHTQQWLHLTALTVPSGKPGWPLHKSLNWQIKTS